MPDIHGVAQKAGSSNSDPLWAIRGVRAMDSPASALGYSEAASPPRKPGPLTGRRMSRTIPHSVTY